jgi:iron complex outermembrane receptor protein
VKWQAALAACVALGLATLAPAAFAQPASQVTGTVHTRGGDVVAGALVRVAGTSLEAVSDAAGHFTLALPAGAHTLHVTADGFLPADHDVVVSGAAEIAVDLRLEPEAHFSDLVTVEAIRAPAEAPVAKTDLSSTEVAQLNRGQEMPFLLSQVPSVTQYSDTGVGNGYAYMYLRGVPQTRMNITLDGVPLNEAEDSTLYFVDFGDFASSVGSVQVQRGVGTSTVGAASFVGSINFASIELREKAQVTGRVGAGSFGTMRAGVGMQSGTIGPGIRLYARASYQDTDGFRDHSGVTQQSLFYGASQQQARSFWKVFGFVGREQTQLAFLAVDRDVLAEDLRFNPMSPEERDRFGQQFVQGQYHHTLGTAAEWSIQGYYNGAGGWYRLWSDPGQTSLLEYGLDWRMLGGATTLHYQRGPWNLTWGLHANDFRSTHTRDVVDGARDYENRGVKNEVNTFAKLSYDVGRWHYYGDAQVRWARFEYEGDLDLGSVSWTFFNPRVGIRYAISDRLSVYGGVGRAMREPARSDMLGGEDNPTIAYDLSAVRPERVVDVEGGMEYQAGPVSVQANLYDMEFHDEIALTGELSEIGLPLRTNVDRSCRRGLELDVAWRPDARLELRLTSNVSRNRISRWEQYYDVYAPDGTWLASEPRTFSDVTPLLTPAFVGNLSATWRPWQHLTVSATGRYVSGGFLDNTNTPGFTTPEWFNLDLGAAVPLTRLSRAGTPTLRVFVNNVLDDHQLFPSGYSYLYLTRDGTSDEAGGTAYYYPFATRNVLVVLDVTF